MIGIKKRIIVSGNEEGAISKRIVPDALLDEFLSHVTDGKPITAQQRMAELQKICDLLVLASPIYSWYCSPPMKAVLDRLVYGMNKYYG